MTYDVITKFETIYTHEKESKIESTDSFEGAMGAFYTYVLNPEVTFCAIIKNSNHRLGPDIIVVYNPKQG